MAGYSYELRFSVAGADLLRRRFDSLAADLQDFREPLKQVGDEVIYPEIKHQFAKQGEPRWPALSPAYARRKAKKHGSKPILQATGDLMASLTTPSARGAIYMLNSHFLVIGTALQTPDGKWNLGLMHQLGAPRASIPPRPPLRLRPSAQSRAVGIFHRWFAKKGKELGVGV